MENQFVYFLKGDWVDEARLIKSGLLSRFSDGGELLPYASEFWACGPGGVAGYALTLAPEVPAYSTARWGWLDSGAFTVGYCFDAKPGPVDLEREQGLSGYRIDLGDGCAWRVPALRRFYADACELRSTLPSALRLVPAGDGLALREHVIPEYEALDAVANVALGVCADAQSLSMEGAFFHAVGLLATNYRIGAEESGLLGLFDAQSVTRCLFAAVDWLGVLAFSEELSSRGLVRKEIS